MVVSHQYKAIGLLFDAIAGIVSLLDLTTDIIIMITWYSKDRMVFFYISLAILILAQISYLAIFYLNHGKEPESKADFLHSIVSCLLTVPFTPFLSFIFYLVSDDDSFVRVMIDKVVCYNFSWHSLYIDQNASPIKQYLDEKLYKHLGFLMEAIIEAFPQSILQLTAIVYYNEPNLISIISILISMCSVCGKLFLLVATDFRGWKLKLFVWLCFVIDFFGVFFIVSFAFYTPIHIQQQQRYQAYFLIIRQIYFYEFVICVTPFALIGSLGIYIYWNLRALASSPRSFCCAFIGISILWIIGLTMTFITMQILNNWWFGLMIIWQATGERLPYNRTGKQFFSKQINWILNSADNRDKIQKICVLNQVMMDKHPKNKNNGEEEEEDDSKWDNIYNAHFHMFLQKNAKTQFKNVSFKQLRTNAINEGHDYRSQHRKRSEERDPRILRAFYYEFYSGPLWEFKQEHINASVYQFISVGTCWILTYIFLPIYLVSRMWHILMPLFIALYLYTNGVVLFVDIDTFQVIMWMVYVSLLCIWFILLYYVACEEYILWHLLPNIERFFCSDDAEENHGVDTLIKERYFQMTLYPLIKNIVNDKFGSDIAYLILHYFNAMKIPFYWKLLVDKFGDEVAVIVMDYLLVTIQATDNLNLVVPDNDTFLMTSSE